jgi:hypothetical protein
VSRALFEKTRLNCADQDPEMFFRWEKAHTAEKKIEQAAEAFDVCYPCPQRVVCALRSLTAETGVLRHGIWGATTPAERREMVRKGVRTERDVWNALEVIDRRTIERRVNGTKPTKAAPTEDGES